MNRHQADQGMSSTVRTAHSTWRAETSTELVSLLARHGVNARPADDRTAQFEAVPVSDQFSKPRTNMLLRRSDLELGSRVYVDDDLRYDGSDQMIAIAMTGPSHRNWRRLRLPPLPGDVEHVFCSAAGLLGSPLTDQVREALACRDASAGDGQAPTAMDRLMSAVAEPVAAEEAAATFRSSRRADLARQLAVVATRLSPPRSVVLWGRPGCGRKHLMVSAAHLLLERNVVLRVRRVSAPLLAAGCILPYEADAILVEFLAEAEQSNDALLLIEDLDTLVSCSPVSFSLLRRALDRGVQFYATVRSPVFLKRLRCDNALSSRLMPACVEPLPHEDTTQIVEEMTRDSGVEVLPQAVQTAMRIAREQDHADPGGTISLIAAAIAESRWLGQQRVGPDEVIGTLKDQWPQFKRRTK